MVPDNEQRLITNQSLRQERRQNLQLRMEQLLLPPTVLRDTVTILPGTEYGYQAEISRFGYSFCNEIVANPDSIHVLANIGEPGTGKTTFLDEFMKRHLSKNGMLGEYSRVTGNTYRVGYLPWGDIFPRIPPELRKTGIPYHDDPDELSGKQYEIEIANTIFEQTLLEAMKRRKEPEVIDIIYCDIPALTGMITQEGVIGIPRGFETISKIGNQRGAFAELERPYSLHGIGMVASHDIRELVKAQRAVILAQTNPESIKAALDEKRMWFMGTQEQIMEYIQEIAPPDEMELIEKDIYFFIRTLIDNGVVDTDDELRKIDRDALESFESFTKNDGARVRAIGQVLLPWLMRDQYGIPDDHGVIVYNDQIIDETHMYLDVASERLLDLYVG